MDPVTLGMAKADTAKQLTRQAVINGVGGGIRYTLLTDAQRLAYTPANQEIVYATDTATYWVGNGTTVGGVTSTTGLSQAQLLRLGYIKPRHRSLLTNLDDRAAGFKGNVVGNSIVQGTGASTTNNGWVRLLGNKLQAVTGVGVANDWAPVNNGVGGSIIVVPMAYTASSLEAPGNIVPGFMQNNAGSRYGILMSTRNENGQSMSAAIYTRLLRTTLRQMLRNNDDVFMVLENPQINMADGSINDGTTWLALAAAARRVCADLGVSLVDVWSKWVFEYQQGIDLRTRMSDGTHPNDIGHAMIASLVLEAMLSEPAIPPLARDTGTGLGSAAVNAMLATSYTATTASVATSTFTGLASAALARKTQTGEGTTMAYSLAVGNTLKFSSPAPIYGFVVQVLQAVGASATVTFNGTAVGGTSGGGTATVLEKGDIFYLSTPAAGDVVITCTGAIKILGITWLLADATDQHAVWPGQTEVGTFAASTLTGVGIGSGVAARTSSTIGDSTSITWYGNQFSYTTENGPAAGKLTEVTDGGSAITVDLYAAAVANVMHSTAQVAQGWHTTVLTVAAKNASSTGNAVKVGLSKAYCNPTSRVAYVSLAAGETMPLTGKWRLAVLERVLSGAPVLGNWTPYAATVTATGSGAALIRLER